MIRQSFFSQGQKRAWQAHLRKVLCTVSEVESTSRCKQRMDTMGYISKGSAWLLSTEQAGGQQQWKLGTHDEATSAV